MRLGRLSVPIERSIVSGSEDHPCLFNSLGLQNSGVLTDSTDEQGHGTARAPHVRLAQAVPSGMLDIRLGQQHVNALVAVDELRDAQIAGQRA